MLITLTKQEWPINQSRARKQIICQVGTPHINYPTVVKIEYISYDAVRRSIALRHHQSPPAVQDIIHAVCMALVGTTIANLATVVHIECAKLYRICYQPIIRIIIDDASEMIL